MSLRPGKLPQAMLAELLARVAPRDPRVLVGPGIGRDAAVIDLGNGRALVAKTDPITFATDEIGWYAVNVNANDIACMGARPSWMLATALLPPGGDDAMPRRIFDQLTQACASLGIELIGGHTEVTLGLDRPIVCGAMLGEARIDDIVSGENVAPGDVVLLTKGIAVEGTALLAREAAEDLRTAGIDDATVERAARMLHDPGISVVPESGAICGAVRPRLLHDPTEGGIATALQEVAAASGMALQVDIAGVPVVEETRAICDALRLDPRGLLASGALLAVVAPDDADTAIAACERIAIPCVRIGTVVSGEPGVIMGGDSPTPLPAFPRDELARFFDERSTAHGNSNPGRIDE